MTGFLALQNLTAQALNLFGSAKYCGWRSNLQVLHNPVRSDLRQRHGDAEEFNMMALRNPIGQAENGRAYG